MAKFKVLFYQKADGSEPVKQFLNSLDKKKTQKTPKKEINLAKKYRNDFLQREEQYHE